MVSGFLSFRKTLTVNRVKPSIMWKMYLYCLTFTSFRSSVRTSPKSLAADRLTTGLGGVGENLLQVAQLSWIAVTNFLDSLSSHLTFFSSPTITSCLGWPNCLCSFLSVSSFSLASVGRVARHCSAASSPRGRMSRA